MQKWEYYVRASGYEDLKEMLEVWGETGWELVAVTEVAGETYTVFFKRPLHTDDEI